mgnify:FL=1
MTKINNVLLAMILIRLLSSFIELTAAFFMFYFKDIEIAIRLNALLGFVGPIVLITVTFLGLTEISSQISTVKLLMICGGVALIILGTR